MKQRTLEGDIAWADTTWICGNGGSAANANHMVNDLVPYNVRAESLCSNVALLTALANDFGYNRVFAQQLLSLAHKNRDTLICLSGSGKSPNIIEALVEANKMGMRTWLITGDYDSGLAPAKDIAGHVIRLGANMQEAEEAQLRVSHRLMRHFRDN